MTSSDQTDSPETGYGKWRRIFGIVFLVSTIIGALLVGALLVLPLEHSGLLPGPSPTPTLAGVPTQTPGPPSTPSGPDLAGAASVVAIAASCLTSITSLIGFAFTTLIGVRKEGREAQSAELERKIRELELERQRLELENRKRERRGDDDQSGNKQ